MSSGVPFNGIFIVSLVLSDGGGGGKRARGFRRGDEGSDW
jgi:hypothetical protein